MNSVVRRSFVTVSGFALACLFLAAPAFAKCPISDGGTLVVRAPVGNLRVDTSGQGAVDVRLSSTDIAVKELCSKDRAEYTADPAPIRGTIDWTIVVPRSVTLDLVTFGGSISMGDSDAPVTLRTTAGSVTVGNIKGKTAIITQGGFIKAGNIGDSTELRISSAGSVEVGNVAGNADLHTIGGRITTGLVTGKVTADTSGDIYIKGARGEVVVTADQGIYIGDALRIIATTANGNITNPRVRGPIKAHTDSGDIRMDSAGGWVEASTGFGKIYCRLVPENFDDDLHVNLTTGVGDITIFIPERLRANIDASIERPALSGLRIVTEFPPAGAPGTRSLAGIPRPPVSRFTSPAQQQIVIQGGGNAMKLHTSLGKIEIFKIRM
jgi:hypothetical protein